MSTLSLPAGCCRNFSGRTEPHIGGASLGSSNAPAFKSSTAGGAAYGSLIRRFREANRLI